MSAESEPVTKGDQSLRDHRGPLPPSGRGFFGSFSKTYATFSVGWVSFLARRSGHSLSLGLSLAL